MRPCYGNTPLINELSSRKILLLLKTIWVLYRQVFILFKHRNNRRNTMFGQRIHTCPGNASDLTIMISHHADSIVVQANIDAMNRVKGMPNVTPRLNGMTNSTCEHPPDPDDIHKWCGLCNVSASNHANARRVKCCHGIAAAIGNDLRDCAA